MASPVFETVRTVLAVREFQDKPIPDEVLRRIVEAGGCRPARSTSSRGTSCSFARAMRCVNSAPC